MPRITINGKELEFEQGQTILQIALASDIEIPHYCYHPGLSIPANCRICLAEVHAPNPRNDNKLEPIPKLLPTCQTTAGDGQVVYTTSEKAVANQKAVMEYLLINHPVDCPVCDQAGECYLQDYSYQYGRSKSRFQEAKIKAPKKDVGEHVLLYSDRCIMCTRCVRFCQEVTGTNELLIDGRGSTAQIDIFPGKPLKNELSGNVIDVCPVGALLDKDFLFSQRVWFLKKTPAIDPITSSGDNIWIEHNDGKVYRIKPRTNAEINKWWITDEVRYGCKFVHSKDRLRMPFVKGHEPFEQEQATDAYVAAYSQTNDRLSTGGIVALISPMISCEDAFHLANYVLSMDENATFCVGPVPIDGEDKTFPGGFTVRAEKAPNARGVRRVLNKLSDNVFEFDKFASKAGESKSVLITGNYPSDWVTSDLTNAIAGKFVVVIDTLETAISEMADVVIPAATFAEKAGTFENVDSKLQSFDRAIEPLDFCKSEAQIALDLLDLSTSDSPRAYNASQTRQQMADTHGMAEFLEQLRSPEVEEHVKSDMQLVVL